MSLSGISGLPLICDASVYDKEKSHKPMDFIILVHCQKMTIFPAIGQIRKKEFSTSGEGGIGCVSTTSIMAAWPTGNFRSSQSAKPNAVHFLRKKDI